MAINVYWACVEKEWMLAEEPEMISKKFYKKNNIDKNFFDPSAIKYCPAFNDNLKNVFSLKSIYDYEFFIEDNDVFSPNFDQNFFDNHVTVRSLSEKFFSFRNAYIFFTDSDKLLTTFYEFPYLENNNITKRCIPVAGQFDIGRWFRNTEFAFYIRPEFNNFKIEKDEVYSYIRFHTKEKINFKQFRINEKLLEYQNDGYLLNNFSIGLKKMENYYKNFKNKKGIIKEIKDNLVD